MTSAKRTAGGLLAVVAVACGDANERDVWCTGKRGPGILVDVRDSASGAPAAAGAPITILQAGTLIETVTVPDDHDSTPVGVVYERAGSYEVIVRRSGHREWRRDGIAVVQQVCHVEPVPVRVRLQRE